MKKIYKAFLSIVVAFTMMLTMMPQLAYAVGNPLPPAGNCGTKSDSGFADNATYTYDSGTLTISGNGEIGRYSPDLPGPADPADGDGRDGGALLADLPLRDRPGLILTGFVCNRGNDVL